MANTILNYILPLMLMSNLRLGQQIQSMQQIMKNGNSRGLNAASTAVVIVGAS